MSLELIQSAIAKGGKIYPSISGGKDSQAMVKILAGYKIPLAGLIHADLGKIEWTESMEMCVRLAEEFRVPLHVVTRTDRKGLLDRFEDRLQKLAGSGKPFWSSSSCRYCTSDMKRDPINKFLRAAGDLVISAEGLRAAESTARAKKKPLTINRRLSAKAYAGMSVVQAIDAFQPGQRLVIVWYPILHFSKADVWATYGKTNADLETARRAYRETLIVANSWPFHSAYVYGNERVSCVFCVLGSRNDLQVGSEHRPELLDTLIDMEERSGATFKKNFSLKSLKP